MFQYSYYQLIHYKNVFHHCTALISLPRIFLLTHAHLKGLQTWLENFNPSVYQWWLCFWFIVGYLSVCYIRWNLVRLLLTVRYSIFLFYIFIVFSKIYVELMLETEHSFKIWRPKLNFCWFSSLYVTIGFTAFVEKFVRLWPKYLVAVFILTRRLATKKSVSFESS